MCKFTNRLFVFAVLSLFYAELYTEASPCSKKRKKCDALKESSDYDHDIYIDQRQKGGENLRIKMDGFLIGAKQPSTSDLLNIGETLLGGLGEDIELGLIKNRNKTSETLSLFNFNGLSSRANQQPEDPQILETLIVEKEAGEHPSLAPKVIEEPGAQTKLRIYRLFNLLRNSHEE